MKAKGLVFYGTLVLWQLLTPVVSADQLVELPSIQEALATATTLETTIEKDPAIDPVAFHARTHSARNPYFYVSAEAMFLHVNADTGGRITASFDSSGTVGREISFTTGTGVDDGYAFAPRFVLGRQLSDNWGIAARYFQLEDTTTGFPRLTPGTTPQPTFGTYTETDTLQMYSIDLEAVRCFQPGKTKIDATFGSRNAAIDVDSLFHAFGVITTGNFANLNLSNGCAFDGTGITSSLNFRRQWGDLPVYFFLGGRGSKLWGHSDSFGRAAGAIASSPSAPLVGAATVTRNNAEADLVILEANVGVQLEFALRHLPATAFLRVAFEYQDWDINGPPTGGAGFGGTIGDLTTSSFSSAGLGDTELTGASVATGFTW